MSSNDMLLKMRIIAEAKQALATFLDVKKGIQAIPGTVSGTFGVIGTVLDRGMLRPLKAVAAGAGILGGVLIAAGGAALKAAADDETLISRLTLLYGSATRARAAFERLEAISRVSPFSPEELTEALIVLDQYGAASEKNLGIVAKTAKLAGTSMEAVARTVMNLQGRGLKSLGITMTEKDDKYFIQWRQHGRDMKVVADNAADARKKLLDVMRARTGAGFKSETLGGAVSTLKNIVEQSFANFGEGLLPAAKKFVGALNAELKKLVESGTFEAWGKKAGEWLMEGVRWFKAAIVVLPKAWDALKKSMAEGTDNFKTMVGEMFLAGAEEFVNLFWDTFRAAVGIWWEIGKLIGSAILQILIASEIPGMGKAVSGMATRKLAGMSFDDISKFAKENKLPAPVEGSLGSPRNYEAFMDALKNRPDLMRQFVAGYSGAGMVNALSGIGGAVTDWGANARGRFGALGQRWNKSFASGTGFDIGGAMQTEYQRQRLAELPGPKPASDVRINPINPGWGPRAGIYIDSVNVVANDAPQFIESMLNATRLGAPMMAAASS